MSSVGNEVKKIQPELNFRNARVDFNVSNLDELVNSMGKLLSNDIFRIAENKNQLFQCGISLI